MRHRYLVRVIRAYHFSNASRDATSCALNHPMSASRRISRKRQARTCVRGLLVISRTSSGRSRSSQISVDNSPRIKRVVVSSVHLRRRAGSSCLWGCNVAGLKISLSCYQGVNLTPEPLGAHSGVTREKGEQDEKGFAAVSRVARFVCFFDTAASRRLSRRRFLELVCLRIARTA
jgi:hypothetical protein